MNAPVVLRRDLVDHVRVTGRLTEPACLAHTAGREPHGLLLLRFAPAEGLPYHARVDLGTDLVDQMATEALLPALQRGHVVSVGGSHLAQRTEHGQPVLHVRGACNVFLLEPHPPAAPAASITTPTEEIDRVD